MDKVKSALKEGHIPIIVCTRKKKAHLELDLVRAPQGLVKLHYIALSHVWADCLGRSSIDDLSLLRPDDQ